MPEQHSNLVEMHWDPITRIVGSQGIYTKIDFQNREVAECHSTSSIFRGYSVFLTRQRPARRASDHVENLRHLRRQSRRLRDLRAKYGFGVKPPALAEWIINLGEAAEYMFDHSFYQDNLVGVDYCERMVRETNPSVWEKAQTTDAS